MLWGALLVATSLLNTYTKFYQNRIKIGRVMNKIWAYATNIIDFGHKLGNYQYFRKNQLDMKGKPKLHIFYEHQLNIYLTVDYEAK